jgi:hypothetical protein
VRSPGAPTSGALRAAYLGWRAAAGPLADFVSVAPFLAAWATPPRAAHHPAARRLAERVLARARAERRPVAVFLDAPPRLGLATAAGLAEAGWFIAPLYGRWPVAPAVLPVEPLARWLAAPPVVDHRDDRDDHRDQPGEGVENRVYCLLLDAQRARRTSRHALRRRFDNRFEYGAYQLPPPAYWRRLGVERVIAAGPAAAMPADLEPYAEQLAAAGLTLDLLSLAAL